MNIKCTFLPQSWVNDYAVPMDSQGETTWVVPMEEVTSLTAITDMSTMDDDPYARDELRFAKSAPSWVREWSGPFEVEWEVIT